MAPDLAEQGFRIVVIGASDGQSAEQAAAAFASYLDVLSDPDRIVYRQYGFGKVALLLRRSGIVVVDQSGVVRYLHRTANPKLSLPKDELLDALSEIT